MTRFIPEGSTFVFHRSPYFDDPLPKYWYWTTRPSSSVTCVVCPNPFTVNAFATDDCVAGCVTVG